jgi:hypothetical protein
MLQPHYSDRPHDFIDRREKVKKCGGKEMRGESLWATAIGRQLHVKYDVIDSKYVSANVIFWPGHIRELCVYKNRHVTGAGRAEQQMFSVAY